VQFHPESICSQPFGRKLLSNFRDIALTAATQHSVPLLLPSSKSFDNITGSTASKASAVDSAAASLLSPSPPSELSKQVPIKLKLLLKRFGPQDPEQGLNYLLYLPESYDDSDQKWPLVFSLHADDGCGSQLDRVREQGLPFELERRGTTPYILVAPQCAVNASEQESRKRWSIELLDGMLTELLKNLKIDEQRVFVTGASMGGLAGWEWVCACPQRFAGLISICAGINTAKISSMRGESALKGISIWAFHGEMDESVNIEGIKASINEAKKKGANVKVTVYPGAGHNSWEKAYAEPQLDSWILACKSAGTTRCLLWRQIVW
jgi:predicted peptidase